jgi:hypothetical protein
MRTVRDITPPRIAVEYAQEARNRLRPHVRQIIIFLEAGANPRAKPAGGPKLLEYARGPFSKEIRALIEQAAGAKGTRKPRREHRCL